MVTEVAEGCCRSSLSCGEAIDVERGDDGGYDGYTWAISLVNQHERSREKKLHYLKR
jgi:hypothetical protein